MARYSRGKYSYGISDRSGFKVRYKDMRTDWDGLRVHKSELDGRHPQDYPRKITSEPQVLKDARPDNDDMGTVGTQLRDVIPMTHGDK